MPAIDVPLVQKSLLSPPSLTVVMNAVECDGAGCYLKGTKLI
jgi:hypothetical protein